MKNLDLKGIFNIGKPIKGPRIFGVGAAKTGTHSIGEMFSHNVNSAHERDSEKIIQLHLDREETGEGRAIRKYLRSRDRQQKLKIDSSQVNIYLIDDLETLFSDSRYILTVRQPLSWLRSILDDSLRRDTSETWHRFRDYRFGGKAFKNEQLPLSSRDLYSLEGYLKYWRNSIERVTSKIEVSRILIVKTRDISSQVERIANFCDVSSEGVTAEKTKSFVNTTRFGVLNELNPNYLLDVTESICGELSRQMFPEDSIADAVAKLNP